MQKETKSQETKKAENKQVEWYDQQLAAARHRLIIEGQLFFEGLLFGFYETQIEPCNEICEWHINLKTDSLIHQLSLNV